MLTPHEALERASAWATTAGLGDSAAPALTVDLRGLPRSFRGGDQDTRLAQMLTTRPWVNIAVVDAALDPVFAELVDAFDVVLSTDHGSPTVVVVDDIDAAVDQLTTAISQSPLAAVALAQLLRLTHTTTVEQALHGESLTYATLQTSEHFEEWLQSLGTRTPPSADGQVVRSELIGSRLELTLDRPAKRNAFSAAMRDQFFEALELVDLDQAIDGVVVRGAGDNFCAGGDLDEFGTTPSPAFGHHVRMVRSVPALLHRVRNRVRFQVHGACVGAGIELPAFAHSVIAHPGATFRLPEVQFGLVPGAGGTVSVTRRCGRQRTAWLALTGATIDADQALGWGLIDRIDEALFP